MKKLLTLGLALLLAVGITGCTSSDTPADDQTEGTSEETTQPAEGETGEKISVGFVTDVGGIDDKSFNQTSYEGIEKYAAEVGEDMIEYNFLQSDADTDYIPNLTTFADEEVDLLAAAGFLFSDAVATVAETYPEQKMLIIDVDWLPVTDSLQQAVFAEHEGSYLVGVAAGLKAKEAGEDTVGFIIGQESATMDKFYAGFQQGVWAVYPEATILYDNADDFQAPELGKTLAQKQFGQGAYIIYHAAGGTGNGVIQETAERRENGEDVWVIGVDTDQYEYGLYGTEGESAVLTSMLKRVDTATYNAVKAVADGTFEGGVVRYTLADDGVGIPEENPNLSEEILAEIDMYKEKIIAGEIVVSEIPE